MSNTITNLIPDVYAALDEVNRELVGFIPAVYRDPTTERAAVGQTVRYPIAPAATATDITPAVTPPNDGDQTIGNGNLTITKARRVPFRWNGEQSRGLNNGGPGRLSIQQDQIAQAIRTLTNEMELDLATEAYQKASRAYGTAATDPFASDLSDPAQVRKILDDNGCPLFDRSLIINTSAGAKMRTLGQLTKANEGGSTAFYQQGTLMNLHGFDVRESAQIVRPTSGTGASATTDNAGYAVGSTVITLASAGTGTILAGDIITFAGDTNKYVVVSGDADTSNGGSITIAAPGLRVAMSAATKAITVVATSSRNVAFRRNALVLAARLPALPEEGDMAADRATIVDPKSGFAYEIAMYKQYRQVQWEICAAWGVKGVKTENIAVLLGA
jgi:hypothetical protein